MRLYSKRNIIGAFFLALIMIGCQKFEGLEGLEAEGYQAEYAIPLFKGQANLQDVFNELQAGSYITVDSNNQILFNYESQVSGQTSKAIFDLFSNLPPFAVDTFMAIPFQLPNNIDIDEVKLNSGMILYTFESNFDEDVTIEMMIEQAEKDGAVFKKEIQVDYDGSSLPVVIPTSEIDISGYTITPVNDSIFIQYTATTASGDNVKMDKFAMSFQQMDFSYAEGYMGNEVINLGRETFTIDFFDSWTQGNVYFENPKINMVIENSFGFPIRIEPKFIHVKTKQGEAIELESPFVDDGINIAYPLLHEAGQSKSSVFTFDKDNSNIREILAARPIEIDYDIDAVPNPESNTELTGFMTDQSQFSVQLELELPIYGTAEGFVTRDSFDVNFEEYENVDFAEFKLTTENGIPLEVAMQVYFANDNGVIIDSLFTANEIILAAAPVDIQGNVIGTTEKFSEIQKRQMNLNN